MRDAEGSLGQSVAARFLIFWLYVLAMTGLASLLTNYFCPWVAGSGIPVSLYGVWPPPRMIGPLHCCLEARSRGDNVRQSRRQIKDILELAGTFKGTQPLLVEQARGEAAMISIHR